MIFSVFEFSSNIHPNSIQFISFFISWYNWYTIDINLHAINQSINLIITFFERKCNRFEIIAKWKENWLLKNEIDNYCSWKFEFWIRMRQNRWIKSFFQFDHYLQCNLIQQFISTRIKFIDIIIIIIIIL